VLEVDEVTRKAVEVLQEEIESPDQLSEEQMLFYSAQGVIDENI
jgi:hypothetical protein